jgi:hypothetical protein
MDVSFVAQVPAEAPLVVRAKGSTRVLYVVLVVCVCFEAVLMVAVPVVAVLLGTPLFLVLLPLFGMQLWLMVLVVREYQGLLGRQLAADPHGVWVRTGLGRRPEVVFLPWTHIDAIEATRKGPVVRITSRRGDALFGARPHWRARSLRRRFGTPFIVDGRRSAEPAEQVVARLQGVSRSW